MRMQKRGELWHFQIFPDGTRKQRQFLPHVAPLVEQGTRMVPMETQRRNQQHVVLHAEQGTRMVPMEARRKNRQRVVLLVEQAITNRSVTYVLPR